MEKVDLKDYIFAQEQNREALTINRFFADRLSVLGLWFARTLTWGLPLCVAWVSHTAQASFEGF